LSDAPFACVCSQPAARPPFLLVLALAVAGACLSAAGPAQQPVPPQPVPPQQPVAPLVEVELQIDFGGSKPPLQRKLVVPRGSNVVAVTRAAVPVDQDWLCCSADDVWAIDGVGPDPRLDRYWFWLLDGQPGPELPIRYAVTGGESIAWRLSAGALPAAGTARVVSLLPAATEIVLALGGDRSLVGLSHLCRQPAGSELPRLLRCGIDSAAWSMAKIDEELRQAVERKEPLYQLDEAGIAALRPTHVFSQGLCPVCAVTPEQAAAALAGSEAERCARLVELSPRSLAGIAANIVTVGEVLGREAAGKIAARSFERRIEAVRALPALPKRPRVAVLEWFAPLWASGEWIAEMVEVAGGEPVLVDRSQPSRRIEWEELLAADPDVLVLAACSMSIARTQRELTALTSAPQWARLRAVTQGKVFVLDGERHVSTPGPAVAEGIEALSRLLRDPGAVPEGHWLRLPRPD
jgi:iron complex transport system substrate-binding protein